MTVDQLLDQLHDLLLHHRPQGLSAEQAEAHLRAHREGLGAALAERLAPWFVTPKQRSAPRAAASARKVGLTPGQRFDVLAPLVRLPYAAEAIGAFRTGTVARALLVALDAPALDAETMASLSEKAVGVAWWGEAGLTEDEARGLPWADVSSWGALLRDALALDLNDASRAPTREGATLARTLDVFDDELLPYLEELEQHAGGGAEGSPRLEHVLAAVRAGRRPTLPLPARAWHLAEPQAASPARPLTDDALTEGRRVVTEDGVHGVIQRVQRVTNRGRAQLIDVQLRADSGLLLTVTGPLFAEQSAPPSALAVPFGREHLSPTAAWSQLQALHTDAQEAQRAAEGAASWGEDELALQRAADRVWRLLDARLNQVQAWRSANPKVSGLADRALKALAADVKARR